MHPMQEIVTDETGVKRFRRNAIVRYVLKAAERAGVDMNNIASQDFSDEDARQFAQLIGYSISGYGDLSYVRDEDYVAAEVAAGDASPHGGQSFDDWWTVHQQDDPCFRLKQEEAFVIWRAAQQAQDSAEPRVDGLPALPPPSFELRWSRERNSYTVSRPNIEQEDCYTAEQMLRFGREAQRTIPTTQSED